MNFEYNLDIEKAKRSGIDPSTVISPDKDGSPLSLFEHDEWDFSFLQGKKINFDSWLEGERDDLFYEIKLQLKTLFFIFIATPEMRFRERLKSYPTYLTPLRKIARLAHRSGCSLADASENSFFQVAFRHSLVSALDSPVNQNTNEIELTIKRIHYINSRDDEREIVGISLFKEEDYDELLNLIKIADRDKRPKRTPLIPSRIFAQLIEDLKSELDYIDQYLGNISDFFNRYYSDSEYFTGSKRAILEKAKKVRAKRKKYDIKDKFETPKLPIKDVKSKEENICESGLDNIFEARCSDISYKSLVNYLAVVQKLCAVTCLVFSGMRTHELQVVPYDALEKAYIKGFGDVVAIKAHTSKLNRGEYTKSLLWVTSYMGEKAIRIAQVIAECFYMHQTASTKIPDTSKLPLWFGSRVRNETKQVHYDYPLMNVRNLDTSDLFSNLIVTQEDIDELETFDALREWNLVVGQAWPFSNHQCRRALVVYASRSGMVSLPSLGTQLKHLSLLMTALYEENSSFAENFITDDEGNIPDSHKVVKEFREQTIFNMSVMFHEKVIAAKTNLSGGAGKQIQKYKDSGTLPYVMENRKATEKAMAEGRMSCRETVVGFCTKKEVCEAYGIDTVVPCPGCSDAILADDKLSTYAEELEWGLGFMDEETPAYKTTAREIKVIRAKLLDGKGGEL